MKKKLKISFRSFLTLFGISLPILLVNSCEKKTISTSDNNDKNNNNNNQDNDKNNNNDHKDDNNIIPNALEEKVKKTLGSLNYSIKPKDEFMQIEIKDEGLEVASRQLGFSLPDDFPPAHVVIIVNKAKGSDLVSYVYAAGNANGTIDVKMTIFGNSEIANFLKDLETFKVSYRGETGFKEVEISKDSEDNNIKEWSNLLESKVTELLVIKDFETLRDKINHFQGKMQVFIKKDKASKEVIYAPVYQLSPEQKSALERKRVTFETLGYDELDKSILKLAKVNMTSKEKQDFLSKEINNAKVLKDGKFDLTSLTTLGLHYYTLKLPAPEDLGDDKNASPARENGTLTMSKRAGEPLLRWNLHYDNGTNVKDLSIITDVTIYPYHATYQEATNLDWTKAKAINYGDKISSSEELRWYKDTTILKIKTSESGNSKEYYLQVLKDQKITDTQIVAKNLAENESPQYVAIATNGSGNKLAIYDKKDRTLTDVVQAPISEYTTSVEYIKYLQPVNL